MNNKFAVFANSDYDLSKIDSLYTHLTNNESCYDFCVVTDSPTIDVNKEYSLLHSFYLAFYDGHIIFLNLQDYIDNHSFCKTNLKSLAIFDNEQIDQYSIKDINLIKINKENIL
jgi:hypothetical protein